MSSRVVGLVPAAGRARRLAPSPCSKEIFPIGFRLDEDGILRTAVASHDLLRKYARGGATTAYVILRDGKWDIPGYFGSGHAVGFTLAYLVIDDSIGAPDTLDRAYPFVGGHTVLFGFPDILFGPDTVFCGLQEQLRARNADITLGLYPVADPTGLDVVDVDATGRVHSVILKPGRPIGTLAWICAAWTPVFTDYLHAFVRRERARSPAERGYTDVDAQGDLPMGAVIKGAVEDGLRVFGVEFPDDTFSDIGTPERLAGVMGTVLRPVP